MMKPTCLMAAAIAMSAYAGGAAAQTVNVYTYREPGLIKPLFDAFTAATGTKVNIVFAKEGLEERIAAEGARSPADLLITTDVARLVRAVELGVTQPIAEKAILDSVPPALRDAAGNWVGLSYRARVVYASKDRVKDTALSYEGLADPKWKGKLCTRDGQHIYNNMLFAAGVAHLGAEKAEAWLSGLKANLAKKPSGGDREVAKDIAAGQCDIGLGNTYYVGLMQNKVAEQKPWAEAIKVILPTFQGGGTHVNLSGVALLKSAPNKADALKLVTWLVGPEAQKMYTSENYEFPVRAGVPVDPSVANFGRLTPDPVPFEKIIAARKTAADIVDKIGYNNGP
jgi:iron(III) transport system substrate-binding protein